MCSTPGTRTSRALCWALILAALAAAADVQADDWPEYRGRGRRGEWTENGILTAFPAGGLKAIWRTPVNGGYSGAAVAGGRVFLTDFSVVKGLQGTERALALDEKTGRILWTREWPANYAGMMWAHGPRATPTVDGDRVYVLGATGVLLCLDVKTGAIRWKKDYVADYKAPSSIWGITGAPLVDGDRLIGVVNGEPDALLMAFDKRTGRELWRALPSMAEPGVNHPVLVSVGTKTQVVFWSPDAINAVDPATGTVLWRQSWRVGDAMNLALPVQRGANLLLSHFSRGSMLLSLDGRTQQAAELWRGKGTSEILTEGLHSMYGTPIIQGDYIYGLCSYGQMRCLRLSTGERVWETQEVTRERTRWASGNLVRNGDRVFISNDRGELIIARLTPDGYQEVSRTNLIKPTTPPGVRRQLGAVHIAHPAYANRHVYVRNDEEVVAYSLRSEDGGADRPAVKTIVAGSGTPAAGNASPDGKTVHVQYMPGLPDPRRIADPNNTAYSTLHLLSGGGAHTVAFVADGGLVLVNTKQPGWGQALKSALALVTNEPVTTIINTQPGPDYTGNNGEFPSATTIVPSADRMTLGEGRNRIDLLRAGPAHTSGDTVVIFHGFNLAYLGELFPSKSVPVIDTARGGSALGFPEAVARVVAALKGFEFIVPGRGDPRHRGNLLTGLPSLRDLQEYADFTRDLVSAIREAKQAGKSADDAASSLTLTSKYPSYDLSGAAAFARAAFAELEK